MRLNVGPKPSSDVTDAGAVTHFVLNILLPKVKFLNSLVGKFLAGLAKALRDVLLTVVSPPESALSDITESKLSFAKLVEPWKDRESIIVKIKAFKRISYSFIDTVMPRVVPAFLNRSAWFCNAVIAVSIFAREALSSGVLKISRSMG